MAPNRPHCLDGLALHAPFNDHVLHETRSRRLRIAYYTNDGFVGTSPACARAVLDAVSALESDGHTLVEWTPPLTNDIMTCFYCCIAADGCRGLRKQLRSDYPFGAIKSSLALASVPDALKPVLGGLYRMFVDKRFGDILGRIKMLGVYEYFELLKWRNELRHTFAEAMAGFDAVIAPGFAVPAPRCGSTTHLSFGCAATAIYNVLDLPVVAVPVSHVRPEIDRADCTIASSCENKGMTRMLLGTYNADDQAGLPVGVQVITPRLTEERALAVAYQLEDALKRREKGQQSTMGGREK
jgi:amidase